MLKDCEAKNSERSYLIEHCLATHIYGLLGKISQNSIFLADFQKFTLNLHSNFGYYFANNASIAAT